MGLLCTKLSTAEGLKNKAPSKEEGKFFGLSVVVYNSWISIEKPAAVRWVSISGRLFFPQKNQKAVGGSVALIFSVKALALGAI